MPEKNPFYGSTFAERKAIREAAEKGDKPEVPEPDVKQVDEGAEQVEDKAVKPAETKAAPRPKRLPNSGISEDAAARARKKS